MKKSVLVSLVLMMVAPLSLMAQKHEFSNGLYWELNGTTLTISGNGPMKDYSSPWEDKGTVEKVVIENGVTSIGMCCFWEYERPHHLKSVVIGNSVTSIGQSAFSHCSSLTSVSIPNSVTSIGELAFSHCSNLTSVSIPNSVTSIGELAFMGCSNLTSIQSLPPLCLGRWRVGMEQNIPAHGSGVQIYCGASKRGTHPSDCFGGRR